MTTTERRAGVWHLLLAALAVLGLSGIVSAYQARVPLATEMDNALAPLAIARDGRVITIRAAADNALKLCVEPSLGQFGATRCFTVGEIRAGKVTAK